GGARHRRGAGRAPREAARRQPGRASVGAPPPATFRYSAMNMRPELRDRALARAAEVLEPVARSSRVLESIAWPRSVEHAFFDAHAEKLPHPAYDLDRARARRNVEDLTALSREMAGDHPMLDWLRALCGSYLDANRMILAVGTRD